MTPEEATGFLAGLAENRIQPGLSRMERALDLLGHPHRRFPHLLVGGTNGKGSTTAFLASCLREAGYRTGQYTSPHLVRFHERIRVDGAALPPALLPPLVEEVRALGLPLSYFEFATALALLHFARAGAQVAVLEVGMGGRMDAVNATDPVLSVITTIARDHTEWLGDDLPSIAREKAGILRPWAPVVVGAVGGEARCALLAEVEAAQSDPFLLGTHFSWTAGRGSSLDYHGLRWELPGLALALPGAYQRDNAACALAAAELLDQEGLCVREEYARAGLASAVWPGRFQTVPGSPPVTVDAAHNPAGMRVLVEALRQAFPSEPPPVWLFSALADKDIPGLAAEVSAWAREVVVVPLQHPRAASASVLAQAFAARGVTVREAVGPERGLALARERAALAPGGRVAAAGSSFLAGAVLPLLGVEP